MLLLACFILGSSFSLSQPSRSRDPLDLTCLGKGEVQGGGWKGGSTKGPILESQLASAPPSTTRSTPQHHSLVSLSYSARRRESVPSISSPSTRNASKKQTVEARRRASKQTPRTRVLSARERVLARPRAVSLPHTPVAIIE